MSISMARFRVKGDTSNALMFLTSDGKKMRFQVPR